MSFNPQEINLVKETSYKSPFTSNATLFYYLLSSLLQQQRSPRTKDTFKDEYDYVIVGGGTAGSALAGRLSEEPCASVLLLENGDHPPIVSDVPGTYKTGFYLDNDYNFRTTPQKHTCRALKGNTLEFHAGRVLGGSSIINAMMYARGNRKNFDDWAAMGAKGWSYKEVLPYFMKSEDNNNASYVKSGLHGKGGPLSVSDQVYIDDLQGPILEAAAKFGYRIGDCNGAIQSGFSAEQATIRNSQRCSAAKAFLVPAENNTNLDILVNAHVNKVIIDQTAMKATHVEFEHKGQIHQVRALREVIISAGTLSTPKILMLSGIGPRKELQKHGIPVIKDLPVGKTLINQPATSMDFLLKPSILRPSAKLRNENNIRQYIANRTGPLASTAQFTAMAFLENSYEVAPKEDFPHFELYLLLSDVSTYKDYYNVADDVYNSYYKKYENRTIFHCYAYLMQPKSVGTVTLRSSNPHDDPVVDPNYLADERDVEDMVQALKSCKKIGESDILKNELGAQPFDGLFPGCEKHGNNETKYLRCYLKQFLATAHHYTSTAKMGDPKKDDTVVSPKLKVKGIENLRVVDASIMPNVVSGHTVAATYMIAEKAADMIKKDLHKDIVRGFKMCPANHT